MCWPTCAPGSCLWLLRAIVAGAPLGGRWPPSWSPPLRSPSWPLLGWRGRGCVAGRPPGCAVPPRWSLPMTGVYLAGRALQARTWRALALAPVRDWQTAWHQA